MADVDRLDEITKGLLEDPEGAVQVKVVDTDASQIPEYLKEYAPISRDIKKLEEYVFKVRELERKDRESAMTSVRDDIVKELSSITQQSKTLASHIQQRLKELKKLNKQLEKTEEEGSATAAIRNDLYQLNTRQFQKVMAEFDTASQEFKKSQRQRWKQQIKSMDPKITDEQIEVASAKNAERELMKQILLDGNAEALVRELEERHSDILKLEEEVLQILEITKDLAFLIDSQSESLDMIEARVHKAKEYVQAAEVYLEEAHTYQNKTRKQKMICLSILFVVILVLIIGLSAGLSK